MSFSARHVLAVALLIAAAIVLPGTVGPVQGASAAPGSLQINLSVDDPNGGYIGGTSKSFSGTYDCGPGFSGSFSTLHTNAPVIISGIPEASSCTVTAATPTGGLLNASFVWVGPTYSLQPVTIGDATTEVLTITQQTAQVFGNVSITPTVSGPGWYIGGTGRVFSVNYTCTLTNGPTISGTVNTSAASPGQITHIGAGSVCTFSETLTTQPGDFSDPAASWVGGTFTPTSATVPANGTTSVNVTNAYTGPTGQLAIHTTVSGVGYIGTGSPFVYDYDCGIASGQIAVAANATASATVPAGVVCSVQQQSPDAGLVSGGHAWATPTWTTPRSVTVPNGGSVTLAVTNRVVAVLAMSGSDNASGMLLLGLLMLVIGAGLVCTTRFSTRRAPTPTR